MKRIVLYLILISIIYSCSADKDKEITLEISASELSFSENESEQIIYIESNSRWEITKIPNWISTSPSTYDGDKSVTIKVDNNKVEEKRTAILIIKAGNISKELTIKQDEFFAPENYKISLEANVPLVGNINHKVLIKYKEPGEKGENKQWTFLDFNIIDNDYTFEYSKPRIINDYYVMGKTKIAVNSVPENSLFVETENNKTLHYYSIKSNDLFKIAYENRNNSVTYNLEMLLNAFPTHYNQSSKREFEAERILYGTYSSYINGYTEIHADGFGKITLPSGTYSNVLRIKVTHREKEVQKNLIGKDRETELITYKWYAKGYRYPLFETHKLIDLVDNTEISSFAFYCPPQNQK